MGRHEICLIRGGKNENVLKKKPNKQTKKTETKKKKKKKKPKQTKTT